MIIIKKPTEIAVLEEGGKILASIMKKLEEAVEPGVKQSDLDKLANQLARKSKARPSFLGYKGFPAGLCVSVNDELVHSPPTDQSLQEGDIVSLDYGIWYEGYCTDMARTFGVGRITKKAAKLISVTKKALDLGIAQIKSGNHLGDISAAIQNYVESKGFSVVRELVGHGVGKKVHEPPQIPNFGQPGSGPELKEGMVLAIEPMVNLGTWKVKLLSDKWTFATADGSLSAHFEDTVAVTKNGYKILTRL